MATLQSQKKAMRKAMSRTLRALSPSDVQEQSHLITSRVLSSPFFVDSENVSCYLSMPTGEVDTSALVSEILRAGRYLVISLNLDILEGKTLFVPKIDTAGNGRMDFVKVYSEEDLHAFPSGLWGIKEPNHEWKGEQRSSALDEGAEQLDLILLPGVAFDRSLSRLGHGKGYYDRFISSYMSTRTVGSQRKPLLVALAFREQILEAEQVPTALHDWKMDVMVGPDGIIRKGKA